MANKRITDVDYLDSLNNNESFFINQNNALKQINKKDIVFDIENGGTGATTIEAARDNLGITTELNKKVDVKDFVVYDGVLILNFL